MLELVHHFGERPTAASHADSDICAPAQGIAEQRHGPSATELHVAQRILSALRLADRQATGKLHRDAFGEALERREMERVLGALVRAGLVKLEADSFDKDGRTIEFMRAQLTAAGRDADEAALGEVRLPVASARRRGQRQARARLPARAPAGRQGRRGRRSRAAAAPAPVGAASEQLVEALRAWRLGEAGAAACRPSASSATAPWTPSPPPGHAPRRSCSDLRRRAEAGREVRGPPAAIVRDAGG